MVHQDRWVGCLLSFNKKWWRGDVIAVFKNVVDCYREGRARLFVEAQQKGQRQGKQVAAKEILIKHKEKNSS